MTRCQACAADNRAVARFCKQCGEALPAQSAESLLGRLIGLEPIRQALTELTETVEGMRLAGRDPRSPYTTLVIGDSGTAKTRLGYLMAEALVGLKLTSKATPTLVNALQPEELDPKSLAAQFDAAKGGVLFVDNAHKLVSDAGDPLPALHLLMQRTEQSPLDPVLIMAGLPYGLKEMLDKVEHRNLVGRIRNIFRIADYDPPQLAAIAELDLKDKGFTMDEATRERLAMRMRWLQRRLKSGDTSIRSVNGRLALDEAGLVERAYYRRKVSDRQLVPSDVQGEVEQRKSIDEILAELNGFVGMTSLKQEVGLLHKDIETARRRQTLGMGSSDDSQHAYHFTLTGNPGTGKTTVARVLGDVFEALGVLPSGHVVEVDRGKLVGQWQGHTAARVNAACDQAIGGILFIDEAYALCNTAGGQDSFGQEAVDTLLKRMEDDRGKYIVIAAGYRDQIRGFLDTNPGLQSRFQRSFHLDDYTPSELTEILARLAAKEKLQLDAPALEKVRDFFADRCARKTKDFANGREARNLLSTLKRAQADRLRKLPDVPDAQLLAELRPEDIPSPNAGSGQSIDEILAELDGMIGLNSVKESVRDLQAALSRARALKQTRPLAQHFVFTGGPGTGKTTVARIMARIFHALGLLPTDRVIEVDRGKLVGQFQGQTAPRVHDACDQALGGILFIDEAYALCNGQGGADPFGQEAVDTLLKRMEDDRGKFIVIAAGYDREMQTFLDSNSGLRSRFTDTIFFPDYTPDEMLRIFQALAAGDGVRVAEQAQPLLLSHLEGVYARRGPGFANGRTVRQLYERLGKITGRRAEALAADAEAYAAALREISPEDIGALSGERRTTPKASALDELNALTGLDGVKTAIQSLQASLMRERVLGRSAPLARHFVFTGNPGTGKTTVARILARVFCELGLLPEERLIETDRAGLIGQYQGHTAEKVQKVCNQALGGVLFIDEAYTLKNGAQDAFGQEAIDALLKRMEDDRGKFVVIAAGYTGEMEEFLSSNSGLRSRFTDTVHFEDYQPAAMLEIFQGLVRRDQLQLDGDALALLAPVMQATYEGRGPGFANGRTVRQLFDRTCAASARRVAAAGLEGTALSDAMRTLTAADIETLSTI